MLIFNFQMKLVQNFEKKNLVFLVKVNNPAMFNELYQRCLVLLDQKSEWKQNDLRFLSCVVEKALTGRFAKADVPSLITRVLLLDPLPLYRGEDDSPVHATLGEKVGMYSWPLFPQRPNLCLIGFWGEHHGKNTRIFCSNTLQVGVWDQLCCHFFRNIFSASSRSRQLLWMFQALSPVSVYETIGKLSQKFLTSPTRVSFVSTGLITKKVFTSFTESGKQTVLAGLLDLQARTSLSSISSRIAKVFKVCCLALVFLSCWRFCQLCPIWGWSPVISSQVSTTFASFMVGNPAWRFYSCRWRIWNALTYAVTSVMFGAKSFANQ